MLENQLDGILITNQETKPAVKQTIVHVHQVLIFLVILLVVIKSINLAVLFVKVLENPPDGTMTINRGIKPVPMQVYWHVLLQKT